MNDHYFGNLRKMAEDRIATYGARNYPTPTMAAAMPVAPFKVR